MKRYRIYVIGLLALMASCVGDDHSHQRAQQSLGGDDSQGVPITFTYTALQVDTAATRSAASTTLSDAVIEANQAVTVRVSQHGQSEFSSYTFTSASGGTLTPPQEPPTYPINGAAVDIRAFTPSSAATGSFSVQQHQETNAGYIASDLMWTKVDNQTSSSSPVPLTFIHKMAKVRITARAGVAISSINQIRLVNVKPTVTFDYDGASGALGAATGSTNIYLFTEGTEKTATGVACIPPQTFTDTDVLAVDVTLADGTSTGTAYYRVDSKEFVGSKLYSLDVTVSRPQVGASITISGWTDSNSVSTTSTGGDLSISDIAAQTYSGSALTPAVTVSYMGSALTSSDYDVYYYSNVDAGTAYVGVLGKNHYAGVHGIKSFTINKANPTYTAPTKKTNLVYNGSAQALLNAASNVSTGCTVSYKLGDGSWQNTVPMATDANSTGYTVYWKITGNDNYNDVAQQTISGITISGTAPSYTPPTAKTGLTYNGSAQALVNAASGVTSGCTVYYKLGDGSWQTTVPTATNANTSGYTVYWKITGNNNYTDVSQQTISGIAIAKANPSCTAPTKNSGLTYNGSAQALVTAASNISTGCTVSYKLGDGSWQSTVPTATNANTSGYTVYWKINGNANYNDGSQQTISGIAIAKATPSCTAPTKNSGLTYNGSAQALVTAASNVTSGCTVYYKLSGGSYGVSVPTAIDANTSGYTVYWKITGNANYNDGSEQTLSGITIAKGTSTLSYTGGAISFTSSNAINSTISRTITGTNCAYSGCNYYWDGSTKPYSVTHNLSTGVITAKRLVDGAFSGYIMVHGTSTNDNYEDPADIRIDVSGAATTYPSMSSATSSSVGKVICSNGHIHNKVNAVTCGGVASGIIAYVGSAGDVDANSSTYKGLAIALSDVSSSTSRWCDQNSSNCNYSDYRTTDIATAITLKNGIRATNRLVNNTMDGTSGHTHSAAIAANNFSTARPSGASGWFLPSMGQWNLILKGLTGSSSNLSTSTNNDFRTSNVNTKITAAGGTGFEYIYSDYYSSTEYNYYKAWAVYLGEGKARSDEKNAGGANVRAVFAF